MSLGVFKPSLRQTIVSLLGAMGDTVSVVLTMPKSAVSPEDLTERLLKLTEHRG